MDLTDNIESGFTLVSVNVEHDKHHDRIIAFLRDRKPHIACFQEFPAHWVPEFARMFGMHAHFQPTVRGVPRSTHDERNPDGLDGLCILSAFPFEKQGLIYYVDKGTDLPVWKGQPNTALRALLHATVKGPDKQLYRIGTLHHTWTVEGWVTDLQKMETVALLDALVYYFDDIVFMGDFNAPRILKDGQPGETFASIARRYNDNIPVSVTTTIDAKLHKGGDLQLVVDGLFSTPHYNVRDVEVVSGVSDHCAIMAKVSRCM